MQCLEGTHFFAGVEADLLAAGIENHDGVIELVKDEIAGRRRPARG